MQDVSLIELYKKQELNVNLEAYREEQPLRLKNIVVLAVAILHILLAVGIWAYAYKFSVVPRISHGVDFRADACHQEHLQSRPYVYHLTISQDINLTVCLEQCPDAIADSVCLYDSNGNTINQSHLCYQTIQSKNQGKFCMPYESYSSTRLDEHLNQRYLERIASDLINLSPNILICLIFSMALCQLVHLLPLSLTLYILMPINAILLCLITLVGFLQYKEERKKCLVGELEQCSHGIQYLITSTICAILFVLYVVQCILHKKHVKTRVNPIKKTYILTSVVMLVQILLVVFTGTAFFMMVSHSDVQNQTSTYIDSGYYRVVTYGSAIKFLLMLVFLQLFDHVHHIQHFLLKYSIMSLLYHFGDIWLHAFITVRWPIVKIYELVGWTDQNSSYSRYLQQHLLHPCLFLWHYVFRFGKLNNLCVYGDTVVGTLKMAVVLDNKMTERMEPIAKIQKIGWHMLIFVSLLPAILSILLSTLQKTLIGYPTTLIESKIVGPITTILLCLLLMRQHCYRMWWQVQLLVQDSELFRLVGKDSSDIDKEISEIIANELDVKCQDNQEKQQKNLQLTNQNLNQQNDNL